MENIAVSRIDQPKVLASVSGAGALVAVIFLAWLALIFVLSAYPALSEYRIHVNLSTKVLTPAPQSTSAVPSPVTTRRTSTLPLSVAPGSNAATPHTRHIASALQRKTRRSVAFHSPRKCNPTMNPIKGNENCDRANCLSNQIAPKIAATSNATATP